MTRVFFEDLAHHLMRHLMLQHMKHNIPAMAVYKVPGEPDGSVPRIPASPFFFRISEFYERFLKVYRIFPAYGGMLLRELRTPCLMHLFATTIHKYSPFSHLQIYKELR